MLTWLLTFLGLVFEVDLDLLASPLEGLNEFLLANENESSLRAPDFEWSEPLREDEYASEPPFDRLFEAE